MLAALVNLGNEQTERRFEDGRILVGYVVRETREVALNNWPIDPDSNSEAVKKRVKEVFPYADHFIGVDGEKCSLDEAG